MSSFFHKLRILFSFGAGKKKEKSAREKRGDGRDSYVRKVDWMSLLPDSVLHIIFLDVAQLTRPLSSPFIEPHPSCAPHTLSQVCSRWRSVALDTPQLWSSIYIRNNLRPELLKLWLERSGKEAALDLRIHAEYGFGVVESSMSEHLVVHRPPPVQVTLKPPTLVTIDQVWGIVVAEIHRWRRVEFILDRQAAARIPQLSLTDAKALQHLSIHLNFRGDSPGLEILDSLRAHQDSSTNKLFKLSWESMAVPSLIYHPAWAGLRDIYITMGLTMDECIRFLAQCVEAQEVSIGCITNDWIGDMDIEHEMQLEAFRGGRSQAAPRHVLLKLRTLSLGLDGSACDCTLILQFFTLPSLRMLRFRNMMTNSESLANLDKLLLRSFQIDLELPESSRELEELSIIDHYIDQYIIRPFFSLRNPNGNLIPVVNIYTRRGVRMDRLTYALGVESDPSTADNLDYIQDASGGTWVGRGGFPDL